jgi:serine/threonine protein kinase
MDDDAEGPLTAGREIAGYRIVRAIGAGRSGITYEALNVGTGRRYAIREFFPTGRASRQAGGQVIFATCEADVVAWALDRFECWTNELRQLRHPNIVEIFHYVKENNTCYVIMEYVDGVTFESWLDARAGPPRPAELKPLLEPVLDAVAYLHKMGHIHRDIAAENIMIRPDGRPVLVDFGALKVIGKRTNPLRPLERRKPSYSPPEQLGDDTLDWTADVYALGGVLYRAFARVPPLDADKRMRAVDVTGHDPYVPIARAAKIDLAAEIASAIDRSLAPRSKDRPQSVVELRNALRWGNDEEHSSPKSENRSQSEARAAIAAGIDHPKSFHPETQDNAERTRTEFDRGYAPETVHPPPHRPAVPQAARTAQQKQWRLGYATIATMALVIIAIGTAAVMQKLLHPDRDTNPEQSPTFAICRQAEFESAKRVGTIPAWTDLLRQCVSGPLADEARRELTMRSAAVREAFNDAKRRDTPEAWDKLLRQFPDLDDLDAEQAAFARAKRTGTIEAWEEFVRQFPSGRLTAAEAGQELQKLVLVRREREAFARAKRTGTASFSRRTRTSFCSS